MIANPDKFKSIVIQKNQVQKPATLLKRNSGTGVFL